MIRFLHQEREVAIEDVPADTTVLDYLREHRGLIGTKEGCASGDCGACTVVLAKATEQGLQYVPINACIAPLGSIHGTQLISVEDIKEGATWHPVQRAMIECHASQCGFCTPGFVMSLFALYHADIKGEREEILEALGGNLCRCTGYRPIIDAAEQALAHVEDDKFSRRAQATLDQLRALKDTESETAALESTHSHYFRPGNADHVAQLLAQHPEARLVAGGTDLFLENTQSLTPLPVLIDVSAASDLHHIDCDTEHMRFGAAVTHRACQAAVITDYPELTELIERFGSLQIRSQGTLAGNIANASPIGDWPPVLLALGGAIELRSSAGTRLVPLDDFFLEYRKTEQQAGEFVATVILPRRKKNLFLRAYKISKRFEDDISSVCGVFALGLEGDRVTEAKVAFGGMAAIPKRGTSVELALTGLDLVSDSIDAAAAAIANDFEPIDDARASAQYRLTVAARLLTRLQQEYIGDSATRVHPLGISQAGVSSHG
ncbi:xanthine dehydrogenase small subunit [Congregibacter variabilis]|uniref:Xanthine dehydrogenase small subunit n=1 Tax=Congregibacter variabilis TaxID=3081200 RepID=A0ABZ0I4W9_9GAMM|nr:xanthine dehydrogenase small subunit [Congregibacter sp. IMCC43200]